MPRGWDEWDRWDRWPKYVPAAERRAQAAMEIKKRAKKGLVAVPVLIEGRDIARTFWGKAWCENLERYSDYSNRLPRGRTYVRNGSVVHLGIESGVVKALVSGSDLYEVKVEVGSVPATRWKGICKDCAGAVDSLVELLQGKFSKAVMSRICEPKSGLFPSPTEIKFTCSCPDVAAMCKHIAAVLYGIGARFDQSPELLFRLRSVDHQELIAHAGKELPASRNRVSTTRVLEVDNLSDIFGIEIAESDEPATKQRAAKTKAARGKRKPG